MAFPVNVLLLTFLFLIGDLIDIKEKLNFQYYDDMYEEYTTKALTIENFLYSYCDDMPTIIVPKERKDNEWESL